MLKYTDDFKKDVFNLYPTKEVSTNHIQYDKVPLFDGLENSEIMGLLTCMGARIKTVDKDYPLTMEGDPVSMVGVVTSGKLQIYKDDMCGALTIIAEVVPGEMFGEVFACAGVDKMPVSIYSAEKTTVMLIDFKKLLTTCSNSCPFHSKVIQNLLKIVSQKALTLNRRIEIISKRSIRDKLMCYLIMEYYRTNKTNFVIPFNRQQLADFLCVERSALSAEMSKMKKENIIDYNKNEFWLL